MMDFRKNIPEKQGQENGNSSKGNTLPNIFRKAVKKVMSACGSTNGNIKGTAIAANILDNNV